MSTLLLIAVLFGQTPARDVVAPASPGTGVIAGIVLIDGPQAKPLRRVTVTLQAGTLEIPRTAITDDTGRFVFTGLSATNYTLNASRPTYVTAYYGATKPGRGPGVPIAVAAGQRITNITLKMLPGAVVAGMVRLPSGRPLADAIVTTRRVTMVNGQRQFDSSPGSTTDDRGEYRVYGLAPGDYVVQVSPSFSSSGSDMRRMTPAEISAAQALSRAAATAPAVAPPPPTPGPSVNFATVYFPGTADVASAVTITLAPGQERTGLDITLQFVQTAQISGTVMGPDGRPPQNARFTLTAKRANVVDLYAGSSGSVSMRPDGSFFGTGIAPGRYVLVARGALAANAQPGGPPSMDAGGRATAAGLSLWGAVEIDVAGRDVSGLMIQLQPGTTLTGKVRFDPPTASAPVPDITRVRTGVIPASELGAPPQNPLLGNGIATTVAQDGSFTVPGVAPGMYRFNITSPGSPSGLVIPGVPVWAVKSVMLNGRDVADLPFEIKPGEDIGDVVVTLSDQATEISGTVFDQLNRPTPGFPIVVLSTNRAYWPAGQIRVRKVQPASDGKFTITGLPPGEYYVCAVTDLEPNSLTDPAVLEALAAMSFKITLAPGEKKTQDLKLGGK